MVINQPLSILTVFHVLVLVRSLTLPNFQQLWRLPASYLLPRLPPILFHVCTIIYCINAYFQNCITLMIFENSHLRPLTFAHLLRTNFYLAGFVTGNGSSTFPCRNHSCMMRITTNNVEIYIASSLTKTDACH